MRRRFLQSALVGLLMSSCGFCLADDVQVYQKDGVTIRETRQLVRQPRTEIQLEQREQTVYRDRYTTDMKTMDRSYVVPITEYQWQPRWEYGWNVFSPPSLVYRQVPVTRWETRKETVRVPVTRREVVPEKQVVSVPVPRQMIDEQEIITRRQVSPTATPTAIASKTLDPFAPTTSVAPSNVYGGGSKLESDPPRQPTAWRAPSSTSRR